MIAFVFSLLAVVLIGFTVLMLVIAIREHREIKSATLKPMSTVRVHASDNPTTPERSTAQELPCMRLGADASFKEQESSQTVRETKSRLRR